MDCDSDPTSTTPMGVHLAFGDDPSNSITVSFFTCDIASPHDDPLVHLFSPHGDNQTFAGTTLGSVAEGRFHHHVALTNLLTETAYRYTVSLSGNNRPRSVPFQFRTAASSSSTQFEIVVIGDMGVNGSASTVSWLSRAPYNFTLHLGDVSYADDYDKHLVPEPSSGRSYEAVYDDFLVTVEHVSAAAPYHVCKSFWILYILLQCSCFVFYSFCIISHYSSPLFSECQALATTMSRVTRRPISAVPATSATSAQ